MIVIITLHCCMICYNMTKRLDNILIDHSIIFSNVRQNTLKENLLLAPAAITLTAAVNEAELSTAIQVYRPVSDTCTGEKEILLWVTRTRLGSCGINGLPFFNQMIGISGTVCGISQINVNCWLMRILCCLLAAGAWICSVPATAMWRWKLFQHLYFICLIRLIKPGSLLFL